MELHKGDCLEVMAELPADSIDIVVTDLPYGTTYAEWDRAIPMTQMWTQLLRLVRGNGAMIFTASQPFTSALVASNPELFRCEWIWNKVHGANFANANRQPIKVHESVLVFARGQTKYNPIRVAGAANHKQGRKMSPANRDTMLIKERAADDLSGMKFPGSIQTFPKHSSQCGLHPTQKPVELMDYLIRTYSDPGDVVLDPCMGSGTTGVACIGADRRFVGIELNADYFQVAADRLERPIQRQLAM